MDTENKLPQLSIIERRELEAFTQGYILGLVADDRAYEGFDEFYSYKDKWDINIHSVGQKQRTIYAVAYPQIVDADGYLSTVTSCWVEIGQYDMNGTPRRKGTAQ